MKDSEFIELLNLYLDHEISAADAARLEAEVQANPARHRIYQDYCRMQKACKVLAQDFATEMPTGSDRKVIAFDHGRADNRRGTWIAFGGIVAAAACVALVFNLRPNRGESVPNGAAPVAQTTAAQPVTVHPAVGAPATMVATAAGRGIERATPVTALSIRNADQSISLTNVQDDPRFAWIRDVRLAPIQTTLPTEQLQLDAKSVLRSENQIYRSSSQTLPADVQSIGFRYQK